LFDAASALSNSLYIGPFRNAINEGAGSYYDLSVGTQFIQVWKQWKTGATKDQNRAVERVTEDIRRIFDFRRLEINAADQMNTLQVTVNNRPYKLRELGAGLTQFIVVFANAAIRRPRMIFIDEPELNLHPSLQIDFITSLAAYAQDGIVFATHSLGLARAVADRIYSLQRDKDDVVVCRPLESTPSYAEFVGEMSFGAATTRSGLTVFC
jgi:ABC-type Mn2+/Zn2+ transport system ATPase subunit